MSDLRSVSRRPHVMVVDDEEMVTSSIASHLGLETGYRISTHQSPREALAQLDTTTVDLIISDFLMPDMNGLEFLREVRKLNSSLPLILLTGYADKENAIRAINEVQLYQFIEKPWDNDQLVLVIRNAIEKKGLSDLLAAKLRELDDVLLQRASLMAEGKELKEELRMARRIQESLLPESLPDAGQFSLAAYYRPALDIGGDFYDVVQLSDDRLALLVADATGHGIQAALSTTLIKFAFCAFKNSSACAAEILAGMNEVLVKGLPGEMFTAAMVLVIDRRSGEISLANAGLPHPLRLKRGSGRIEAVSAAGLLLGLPSISDSQPRDEQAVRLDTGDGLLLFTDGLTETQNTEGELFEDGYLSNALLDAAQDRGNDFLQHLANEIRTFRGDRRRTDDLTMIVIETKA